MSTPDVRAESRPHRTRFLVCGTSTTRTEVQTHTTPNGLTTFTHFPSQRHLKRSEVDTLPLG